MEAATIKKETLKFMGDKIHDPVRGSSVHPDLVRASIQRDSQVPLDAMSMFDSMDSQLQNPQVTSTVLDSPVSLYQGWPYQSDQCPPPPPPPMAPARYPYPVFDKTFGDSWDAYNYPSQGYPLQENATDYASQFYHHQATPKSGDGCFPAPYHAYQPMSSAYQGLNLGWSAGWEPARRWGIYGPQPFYPVLSEPMPKVEPLGEVTDYSNNEECFKDPQMGSVAIALGHGSVLFECAKHELHSTTALRRPNRLSPARISLVFYQHRNLNRGKHGGDEWEEKMRLRKLGVTSPCSSVTSAANAQTSSSSQLDNSSAQLTAATAAAERNYNVNQVPNSQFMMRSPTYTTMTWTTLFPMHPCMITGPYQEGGAVG